MKILNTLSSLLVAWIAAMCIGLPAANAALVNGQVIRIYSHGTQMPSSATNVDAANNSDTDHSYGYTGDAQELVITNSSGTTALLKSFCLEENEYFAAGNSYTVYGLHTLSADLGGVTGGPSDPISAATGNLFVAWATSILDSIDIGAIGSADNFVYSDDDWAAATQLVVWRLEGERSNDGFYTPGSYSAATLTKANDLYSYFVGSFGLADYTGLDVDVVNIYNFGTQTRAQSFLQLRGDEGELPTPEPTSVIVWALGLVIGGAGRAIRNRLKAA